MDIEMMLRDTFFSLCRLPSPTSGTLVPTIACTWLMCLDVVASSSPRKFIKRISKWAEAFFLENCAARQAIRTLQMNHDRA